jgi:hypothetical protein
MFGINAQAHGEVYRFVELGELYFLEKRNRFCKRVRPLLYRGARFIYILSRLIWHFAPCLPQRSVTLKAVVFATYQAQARYYVKLLGDDFDSH